MEYILLFPRLRFNPVPTLPSAALVYTILPSITTFSTNWTGDTYRWRPVPRPPRLYTLISRPLLPFPQIGREAPIANTRFPVHSACIHNPPVHYHLFHKLDGRHLSQTPAFPSTTFVYTNLPSITTFSTNWTGDTYRWRPVSRPPRLYTPISRPSLPFPQNGRETPLVAAQLIINRVLVSIWKNLTFAPSSRIIVS